MVIIPIAGVWAFYGLATWGWALVKGYNITFAEWFNPVHPYYWPGGTPPMVPAGHLFPTKSGSSSSSAGTAAKVQVA